MKTLILERRHLVGGAAITEELRPGYWFTTFSYALSLLRPQIIQELELTKHGLLPLMSTRFAPGRRRRVPASTATTTRRCARSHLAARRRCLRAVQPRPGPRSPGHQAAARHRPAGPLQRRSGGAAGAGGRGLATARPGQADAAQRGAAVDRQRADFLDDYFESPLLKGYLASSSIIGSKVGPRSQGRPGPALPLPGRARRRIRDVGLPQGRQRRLHAGAGTRGGSVRRRDPAGGRRRARLTREGEATGVQAGRRDRDRGRRGGQRPGPAAHLPRAGRSRASCPTTW